MPESGAVPIWALALVWPTLGTVILIAWLLRRARGSTLKLSGFGVTLEVHDVVIKPDSETKPEEK